MSALDRVVRKRKNAAKAVDVSRAEARERMRQYWADKKEKAVKQPKNREERMAKTLQIKAVGLENRMQHFGRVKLLARDMLVNASHAMVATTPEVAWDRAEKFIAFADAKEAKARAGK